MTLLNLSVAKQDGFGNIDYFYKQLLGPILRSNQILLNIETISWEDLWNYTHQQSMATELSISEIGSTWLHSLVDAGGLMPIPSRLILELGGKDAFVDAAWRGCPPKSADMMYLPWLLDVRVIYYWRDHLSKAHIDESTAFSSIEAVDETMKKLNAAKLPGWGAPTYGCINTLYNMASWIWAKGRDFMTEDGLHTAFCDPEAIDGILAYFNLASHMPGPYNSYAELYSAFAKKQISAFMCGPWVWSEMFHNPPAGVDTGAIGIALPPGPSFLGGANFVMWRGMDEIALTAANLLLANLSSAPVQQEVQRVKGLLPVNRTLIKGEPYSTDINFRSLVSAMETARPLPQSDIWGHIESSLVRVFGLTWQSIVQNNFKVKKDVLKRHLEPLAGRFERMLDLFESM